MIYTPVEGKATEKQRLDARLAKLNADSGKVHPSANNYNTQKTELFMSHKKRDGGNRKGSGQRSNMLRDYPNQVAGTQADGRNIPNKIMTSNSSGFSVAADAHIDAEHKAVMNKSNKHKPKNK